MATKQKQTDLTVLVRSDLHGPKKSTDCLIGEIKGKKVKFVYEAYNASELCNIYFFDGDQWNPIYHMTDLGFCPSGDAYVWGASERKKRADTLFKKAESMCLLLL